MQKDFDSWNSLKKDIDSRQSAVFCNVREIWWASLGLNIGSEEDGKNDLFERPIIIIKVFNRNMLRIIPLTSSVRDDLHHFPISHAQITGSVRLSQMKTIGAQRLTRKLGRLDTPTFHQLVERLKNSLV